MQYRKASSRLRKMWLGFIGRCPNCEEGSMFEGFRRLKPTCSVCGVRFERRDGESLGAMMFMLGFAEIVSVVGFFVVHFLFAPPILAQVMFWISFIVIFCVFFYRNARGLWVTTSYLTGGVYRDDEEPEQKKKIDWTKFNP
jgi:uncharacterized protein (DUF983 family)